MTDTERLLHLTKECKQIEAFEYEGVKYLGYFVNAVKDFISSTNYPADFHVWLQTNYTQIK